MIVHRITYLKTKIPTDQGFTLIELLIALAIITVMAGLFISPFTQFRQSQILKAEAEQILSILNQARANTLAAKNDSNFGIHFATDSLTVFIGANYDPADPNNQIISLAEVVTISDISLSGAVQTLYFNRLTGRPNVYGAITLSLVNNSDQNRIITITSAGALGIE